jgi:DNA-directed RNA polymerase subunit RPC12/RpoP
MAGNQKAGDQGEMDVVNLVPCPNCGKKLMMLPKNYPLYDVQCTGCLFRAQVKTNNTKPKPVILAQGGTLFQKS